MCVSSNIGVFPIDDSAKSEINKLFEKSLDSDIKKVQLLERIYTYPIWDGVLPKEYKHQIDLMEKYFLRKGLQAELDVILKLFNG